MWWPFRKKPIAPDPFNGNSESVRIVYRATPPPLPSQRNQPATNRYRTVAASLVAVVCLWAAVKGGWFRSEYRPPAAPTMAGPTFAVESKPFDPQPAPVQGPKPIRTQINNDPHTSELGHKRTTVERKSKEKPTGDVQVKGFYRTNKDGTKTWVEPFTRKRPTKD